MKWVDEGKILPDKKRNVYQFFLFVFHSFLLLRRFVRSFTRNHNYRDVEEIRLRDKRKSQEKNKYSATKVANVPCMRQKFEKSSNEKGA